MAITAKASGLSDTPTLMVTEAPSLLPMLSIEVDTDSPAYRIGDTVTVTVTVSDGSAGGIAGATVSVQMVTGRGAMRYSDTAITGSDGVAVFHYTIAKRDGAGPYRVVAEAERDGYAPATGSATFEVAK